MSSSAYEENGYSLDLDILIMSIISHEKLMRSSKNASVYAHLP